MAPSITWISDDHLPNGPLATHLIEVFNVHSTQYIWKCPLQNAIRFIETSVC